MNDYNYIWNLSRIRMHPAVLAAFLIVSTVVFISNAAVTQCDCCNQFRYRARINVTDQQEDASKAGPIGYDVFLTIENPVQAKGKEPNRDSLKTLD